MRTSSNQVPRHRDGDQARRPGAAPLASSVRQPFQYSGNRILSALPEADIRRLNDHLTRVPLEFRQALYRPEHPIRHVFFPEVGVCSVMSVMRSGATAEVGTVGNEGLTGLVLFFGEDREPSNAIVQVPGMARRMPADVFVKELDRKGALYRLVGFYAHARLVQVMQSAACNQLHSLPERTCKWLLTTHDRVVGNEFALTHEFLSLMLGARRPTVSTIANQLQDAGLITYRHGHVTIVDRQAIEAGSCECYAVVKDYFENFLRRLSA